MSTAHTIPVKVIPVIHFLDRQTAFEQTAIAHAAGAAGVFLISHHNNDDELTAIAREIKQQYPEFPIGINLLSNTPLHAARSALLNGLDMVWADNMGVSSYGLTDKGEILSQFAKENPQIQLFASVAFKYQPNEPAPCLAAKAALGAGFIPTTSGAGTGSAPEVSKISAMSSAVCGILAVASGMTPENVPEFAPHLSHILVATGISLDEYRIDPIKLRLFMDACATHNVGIRT